MTKFIRARSVEHKEQRLNEIKLATEKLFISHTYHDITLSSIADSLSWSRANLYKYVTSKEEIFLEILADKQEQYYSALITAFPSGSNYSADVFSDVWTGILNSNRDYLHYYNILQTIIETNVSLERLTEYKKHFYKCMTQVILHFSNYLNISEEKAVALINTIQFHALGLNDICQNNPLAYEAARLAGIPEVKVDFQETMKIFISMCINYYCNI